MITEVKADLAIHKDGDTQTIYTYTDGTNYTLDAVNGVFWYENSVKDVVTEDDLDGVPCSEYVHHHAYAKGDRYELRDGDYKLLRTFDTMRALLDHAESRGMVVELD